MKKILFVEQSHWVLRSTSFRFMFITDGWGKIVDGREMLSESQVLKWCDSTLRSAYQPHDELPNETCILNMSWEGHIFAYNTRVLTFFRSLAPIYRRWVAKSPEIRRCTFQGQSSHHLRPLIYGLFIRNGLKCQDEEVENALPASFQEWCDSVIAALYFYF